MDIVVRERRRSHVFTDGIACDEMCMYIIVYIYIHINLQRINEQRQPLAGSYQKSSRGCCHEQIAGRSVWENFDLTTMSPQAMPGPRRWNYGRQTQLSRRHRRAIKNS